MEFSRQAYWSGLPFPFQGSFLTQGLSLHLQHWRVNPLLLYRQGSPNMFRDTAKGTLQL